MHTDVADEEELRRLFEAVVGGVTAPTPDLVESGFARGRRLRRRRYAVVVTVAAAVLATAGVSGIVLGVSGVRAPAPAAKPSTSPEPRVPIDTRSMAAILASLMPSGGAISGFYVVPPLGSGLDLSPRAGLSYDDGGGRVEVGVSYSSATPGDLGPCHDPDPSQVSCTAQSLPDGSRLYLSEYVGDVEPRPGDVWQWPALLRSAYFIRADGRLVIVDVRNNLAPGTYYGAPKLPPTRPDLSLTRDQLAAIAQSPLWQDTVPISIAEAGRRLPLRGAVVAGR